MNGKKITSLDDLLDYEHYENGTPTHEKWEQEYEAFKLGVLIEEARKNLNMTQEELAQKCGTNTKHISRIENNASDVRLSTLMRIVNEGLGGTLKLTIEI